MQRVEVARGTNGWSGNGISFVGARTGEIGRAGTHSAISHTARIGWVRVGLSKDPSHTRHSWLSFKPRLYPVTSMFSSRLLVDQPFSTSFLTQAISVIGPIHVYRSEPKLYREQTKQRVLMRRLKSVRISNRIYSFRGPRFVDAHLPRR